MSRAIDLTGQRFGRLTVVKRAPSKDGKTFWECNCDCGNGVTVFDSNLRYTQHTKSCGCLKLQTGRNSPRFKDKTGQRFGLLTVIKTATPDKRGTRWECRCDCGRVVSISTGGLRTGGTKSCGCLNHRKGKDNRKFKDLTGKRFGKLTIIKPDNPNRFGQMQWDCHCDCGKVTTVASSNLKRGLTKSCGCANASGDKSPSWKGGVRKSGKYKLIYTPDPSKFRVGGATALYLPEHVVIMSKHLGRPLHREETIHHRNGNKLDNRIENLELWSSSHPGGQRVEDLVKWAKEILALYEPKGLV